MSALDELGAVFTKYDLSKSEEAHERVRNQLSEIHKELTDELDPGDSEIDEEERNQIRETYRQTVQNDLQALLEGDSVPDEFPDQVDAVIDDLEETLRSPQARAVVTELSQWLLSTGVDPLDQDQQAALREIVKDDIDAARKAVRDASSTHSHLRGHLGPGQEPLDELLRQEVISTDSVSDLETIASGLQKLRDGWIPDWSMEYDTDSGNELASDLRTVLQYELVETVNSRGSITGVASALSSGIGQVKRNLDTIQQDWQEIETRTAQIDLEDGSFDIEQGYAIVDNSVGDDPALSSYQTVVSELKLLVGEVADLQSVNPAKYQQPGDEPPQSLAGMIADVTEQQDRLEKAHNQVLEADTTSDLCEAIEAFDDAEEAASGALEELQQSILTKIEASRLLAQEFELETLAGELETQYTAAVDEETVTGLLEIFKNYTGTAEGVRSEVRTELSESEEALFTFCLETEQDDADVQLWDQIREEFDREPDALLADLAQLEQRELIRLDIEVA